MTVALRRRMQDLANAVPQHSKGNRDQLWRNVVTELNHREAGAGPHRSRRFRSISLFGTAAIAALMVVLLPLMNHSFSSPGGYFLRTQFLEAASRKEQGAILDWREGNAPDLGGFLRVASNPALELLLYEDGTQFLLRHKSSGQIWSTSPDVRDTRVPEALLGRMNSLFAIRYGDDAGRVDAWANPIDHMTMLEYHPLSSGMGLRFVFESLGIAVRIDYQLGDGFLQVSIPEEGIQEYGSYRVKAIEVLPFFDTVGDQGEKRLLMTSTAQFERPDSLAARFAGSEAAPSLLFGISGEKAGFLAEVIDGSEVASIHVDPSGFMVDANRVFVEFLVGKGDKADQSASSRQRTVRYYAITDEHVGHDGIAEVFQRYIKERLGANRRVTESVDLSRTVG